MKQDRTKLLLGILGILLVIVLWNYLGPLIGFGGGDAGGGGEESFSSMGRIPGAGREQARPAVEEVEELRIADLRGTPRSYSPGRDPWRFVDPPPPPPPPPPPGPSEEELRRMREAEERARLQREAEAARLAAEAAKPKPPQFTLKYLGKFGPADRPIGTFTDGKNIYNVQEGGVLQGKFIVAQLGYESVEIQFVGFPDWPAQRFGVGR